MTTPATTGSQDTSPFDRIRQTEDGVEFWSARAMQPFLAYTQWRNMNAVVTKAKAACRNNGHRVEDHIADASNMVEVGSGARRNLKDYKLSRYACYLVAMNGDPEKAEVAAAQSYFVEMTRAAELAGPTAPPAISSDPLEVMLALNSQVAASLRGAIEAKGLAAEAKALAIETKGEVAEVRETVAALAAKNESHSSLRDFLRDRKIRMDKALVQHFGGKIAAECKAAGAPMRKHYDAASGYSFNLYPVSVLIRWEPRLRAASDGSKLTLFA